MAQTTLTITTEWSFFRILERSKSWTKVWLRFIRLKEMIPTNNEGWIWCFSFLSRYNVNVMARQPREKPFVVSLLIKIIQKYCIAGRWWMFNSSNAKEIRSGPKSCILSICSIEVNRWWCCFFREILKDHLRHIQAEDAIFVSGVVVCCRCHGESRLQEGGGIA